MQVGVDNCKTLPKFWKTERFCVSFRRETHFYKSILNFQREFSYKERFPSSRVSRFKLSEIAPQKNISPFLKKVNRRYRNRYLDLTTYS